jgi:hypothetical protein
MRKRGASDPDVRVVVGCIKGACGEVEPAKDQLAEAPALARAKCPRLLEARALEAFGMLAVQQGQSRHAVKLLATAAMPHRVIDAPVGPIDQPLRTHWRLLACTRTKRPISTPEPRSKCS